MKEKEKYEKSVLKSEKMKKKKKNKIFLPFVRKDLKRINIEIEKCHFVWVWIQFREEEENYREKTLKEKKTRPQRVTWIIYFVNPQQTMYFSHYMKCDK